MKITAGRARTQLGFTRREVLVGSAVVLALLGLAAVENRKSSAPACGPGCATCGNQVSLLLDRYAVGGSNPPSALAPGPAAISTGRVDAATR